MNGKIFIAFNFCLMSFVMMQITIDKNIYEIFFDITIVSAIVMFFLIYIENYKPFDKEVRIIEK